MQRRSSSHAQMAQDCRELVATTSVTSGVAAVAALASHEKLQPRFTVTCPCNGLQGQLSLRRECETQRSTARVLCSTSVAGNMNGKQVQSCNKRVSQAITFMLRTRSATEQIPTLQPWKQCISGVEERVKPEPFTLGRLTPCHLAVPRTKPPRNHDHTQRARGHPWLPSAVLASPWQSAY
ncbi:hypothetical protein ES702_06467 [subsurface metagenome]